MKLKKENRKKEERYRFKETWFKELSSYGISKKDYDNANMQLTKKFRKKAIVGDIIWSLFNEAIIRNINDLLKKSSIYFLMGQFIRTEGKHDPNQYYRLSTRTLLMHYKLMGVNSISARESIF